MQHDYEQGLRRLKTACAAQDVARVEAVVSELEKSWADAPGEEYILAIRRACDDIAGASLKPERRSRDLLYRLAEGGIRRAGASHLDVQFHLLDSYLRVDPAASTDRKSEWPRLRKESAGVWCDVWRKLEEAIDPAWDENDPKNDVRPYQPRPGTTAPPGGAGPEAIADPKARAEYEAHIAKNARISERNRLQKTHRRLKRDYAPAFRQYLQSLYSEPPDNIKELGECLVKLQDQELRKGILEKLPGRGKR